MSECPICGANKPMNCDCTRKEREQHGQIEELAEEAEIHRMQLAAIMTASIQNTESTAKDRIGRENPYWTQAYQDVCTAIDREMRERKRAEEAEAKCAEMRVQSEGIAIRLEAALASLADAGAGKAYDPSWCRPKSMSREEIGERCIQAYHQIWHALETLRKPS